MITLKAEIRKSLGRKNQPLRKKGLIPAVLYGEGLKSESLKINLEEITKIYREVGDTGLVSLTIEGGEKPKTYPCLIYGTQRDPLTDLLIHVDFYHPSMKKKVTAEVPLVFEGLAPAVKEKGGVLVKDRLSVEVKALVTDLPKEIQVDITKLHDIHDKIFLQDLMIDKALEVLGNPDEVLVSVVPPKAVEEELEHPIEEEAVTGAEETAETETEGKGGKENKEDKDKKESKGKTSFH